jgi:hypothetical protein
MSTLLRGLISCLLTVTLVGSIMAADSGVAMLYTNGTAWINGNTVPHVIALFSGDLVQTKSDSLANIKAKGVNVVVLSDSLVQFERAALKLEHGRVNVVTTRGLTVRVGVLKVVPVSSASTEFEVVDTDGTAKIIARKGNLLLDDGKTTSILAQGQETTRHEQSRKDHKGGAGRRERGAASWIHRSRLRSAQAQLADSPRGCYSSARIRSVQKIRRGMMILDS